MGVEPTLSDWQPDVIPIYDTRSYLNLATPEIKPIIL